MTHAAIMVPPIAVITNFSKNCIAPTAPPLDPMQASICILFQEQVQPLVYAGSEPLDVMLPTVLCAKSLKTTSLQ